MWNDEWRARWDRAREQHLMLAKAAKMEPVKKGLLTDGCRGQANVRWIERHGRIPDGPSVGKPFRLYEFQRDIIHEIYGQPAYWQAVDAVLKKRRAARQGRENASQRKQGQSMLRCVTGAVAPSFCP